MTYSELFEDVLREIIVEYNDQLSDGDILYDSVGFDTLPTVSNSLLTVLPNSLMPLKPMIEGIMTFSSSPSFNGSDDVPDYSNLRVKYAQYENKKNKRSFFLNDLDLSVLDSEQLYTSVYDDKLMSILMKICYTPQYRIEFFHFITGSHTDATFHYIYDATLFNDSAFKAWDLYHYALLRYLNKGSIITRDSNLEFPANQRYPISTNINFDLGVKYNQFIDIYDVISEFNHTTDVLSAFVKMYQILEYIIYRKELVKIIEGANIKQSFVRQVKGIDRKYLNGEREAFTDGLFRIIDSFDGEIENTDITQGMIDFCKKYYERTGSGNSYINSAMCNDKKVLNKSIAKFIYDTRCAIVHNKEAEFHITYFNYDEYSAIIPLMKKVINGISKRIITLMNTPESVITFTKDHLELY